MASNLKVSCLGQTQTECFKLYSAKHNIWGAKLQILSNHTLFVDYVFQLTTKGPLNYLEPKVFEFSLQQYSQ